MHISLAWKISFAAALVTFLFLGLGSNTSGQYWHHDKGGKDSDKGGKDSGKGFDRGNFDKGGKNESRNDKSGFDFKGSRDSRDDKGNSSGGWGTFSGPATRGSVPHSGGTQGGNSGGASGGGLPSGGFGGSSSGPIPNGGNHFQDRREKAAENHYKNNQDKSKHEKQTEHEKSGTNKNLELSEKLKEQKLQKQHDRVDKLQHNHDQQNKTREHNQHEQQKKGEEHTRERAQKRMDAMNRLHLHVPLPQFGDGSYLAPLTTDNTQQQADDEEENRKKKEADEERERERRESKARDDEKRDRNHDGAPPPPRPDFVEVTLAGLRVNHETKDDPLDGDGQADEIFIRCWAIIFDRLANTLRIESDTTTRILGDITRDADRVKGGSASSKGGLRSGDTVPDVGAFGPVMGAAGADRLPLRVYTGRLTDNELLLIVPVIFEWDDNAESPGTNRSVLLDAFIRLHREEILSSLDVVDATNVLAVVGPALGFPLVHGDAGGNRPVGMSRLPNFEKSVFSPHVLLFSRATAERCARNVFPEALGDKGGRPRPLAPGIVPLRYADEESLGTGGDYTLFLQVRG